MQTNNEWKEANASFPNELEGKRILFACVPADGHFNPLTGLAVYLKEQGCEVGWYSSKVYAEKIARLQITHYPFRKALEVHSGNLEEVFPERTKMKNPIAKLSYDLTNFFILRATEYLADIEEIHAAFPFDLMIADCTFSGIPFVKEKLNIPVIAIGISPLIEASRDLAPGGLGMTPSTSFPGRLKQDVLRFVADKVLFRKPNGVMHQLLREHGIAHTGGNCFDIIVKKSTLLLQSGTPSFEYKRSDLGSNVRFIGALLPHSSKKQRIPWNDERLSRYLKVVLVTQGTVERNHEKILVPTLEAFKNTDTLVIATTGGFGTKELKAKYSAENLIIEDFIPFEDVMPYADVYITNGGYGGVLLGIQNELPLVVAGIHEGKNEINARIGYFKLGINLNTEKPTPEQIRSAVGEVLAHPVYKKNIRKLSAEFSRYQPHELCARYVGELIAPKKKVVPIRVLKEEPVY